MDNKTDKENERKVTIEEGTALAVEYKFKFKEISYLKNENVVDAFEALIEMWNVEYHKKKLIQTMRNEELPKSISRLYTSYKINLEDNNIIRHNSTVFFEDKKEEFPINTKTFQINEIVKKEKRKCHC